MSNYLSDFHDMLERQSVVERERVAEFNAMFPPDVELTIPADEVGEETVVGIWFGTVDGSVKYSYKKSNGYHPSNISTIRKEIVEEIRRRK